MRPGADSTSCFAFEGRLTLAAGLEGAVKLE